MNDKDRENNASQFHYHNTSSFYDYANYYCLYSYIYLLIRLTQHWQKMNYNQSDNC